MYFEGSFSKDITSIFNEVINIKDEIVENLNSGSVRSDNIREDISENYVVNGDEIDIDFAKYVTVDECSISFDEILDRDFASFSVDCDFDMERFALDNNLESRDIERE